MAGSRRWPGACWDWGGRGPPRAPRPLLLTLVLGVRSGTWRSRLPGASRGSGPSAGGLGDTPGLSGLHLGPMLLSVPTLRGPPPPPPVPRAHGDPPEPGRKRFSDFFFFHSCYLDLILIQVEHSSVHCRALFHLLPLRIPNAFLLMFHRKEDKAFSQEHLKTPGTLEF